jgi:beta-mannosidase
VRKISYSLAGSDNLALSVNGVPVMAKGGDWGIDEALKRIPRQRLEAQVRMHQLANCTMIRH